MEYETNSQLQLAFDYLQYTNQNVFLTGKAGTGKTTFLHHLRKNSPKRMVVVAPTGVAAINAGGVTIHSFFQISFGPQIPHDPALPRPVEVAGNGAVAAGIKRFNREKINIIRSLDLLVIDEISMVRADLLDAIDEVLRRFKNRYQPFGGVQLLMIGDLQQLAPVIRDEDWELLKSYYETCYFFSSRALQKASFVGIELKKIFRQSDQHFIDLLNNVRENRIDEKTLKELNARYVPGFEPDDAQGYITLTTHNYQSQQINESKLVRLKTKKELFSARVEGEFPEYAYPTDVDLWLKVGAQVMFVKNDLSVAKRYYNGKIGWITAIGDETVQVLCPGETDPILVEPVEWQNCKYILNETTQEIDEEVIGQFSQIPLKLAWAITIHKSQGLTFEKAIIDAQLSFAHGQVYVALSRCKTLEGMVLRSQIGLGSVKNDRTVTRFSSQVEQNQPDRDDLAVARCRYQQLLLMELFDFKPLHRHLQTLLTKWDEDRTSLQGNLEAVIKNMLPSLRDDMIAIAEKFDLVLDKMLTAQSQIEDIPELWGRLKNGCVYFSDKLRTIVQSPLAAANFRTDNKAVRKSILEAFDRVEGDIVSKINCLNAVKDGFSIKSYLEARAKSSIEGVTKTDTALKHSEWSSVSHPILYKQLLDWRNKTAEVLECTLARVFGQAILLELVEKVPASLAELKAIDGMGAKKIRQFGPEILRMIVAYRKEQGLSVSLSVEKEIRYAGLSTQQLSYELFKAGKSIGEISEQRKLTRTTIIRHLIQFVMSGELVINDLISKDKYQLIYHGIINKQGETLTEILAGLGEGYEYWEISLVAAYSGLKVGSEHEK